jgi:hypothetical protein
MKLGRVVSVLAPLLLFGASVTAAVPGDEHWDNQFGPVGVNEVAQTVIMHNNNVYVGGKLTAAGNTRANSVAGYDGTNWFALNKGLVGSPNFTYVFALASDANYLYAGGVFTNADNSGARTIARWDGTTWSSMGSELKGYLYALKMVGTNLYAGGVFTPTASTIACVARWTGASWEYIGGEFGGRFPEVYALETDGTNLLVGGSFTSAGGTPVTNVAAWNGSSWSAVGAGVGSGIVHALLYQAGRLYVGGSFTNTTGPVFTNLAVWDGTGFGPWFNANRRVLDIISDGTNIYVGGEFNVLADQSLARIARFDGANWFPLGAGVQGFGVAASPGVYKMCFGSGGRLYVAGNFNAIGGIGASHAAVWDGMAWAGMGGSKSKGLTHFTGRPDTSLPRGTELFVGGVFTEAGDKVVNSIGRWDGTNWFTLGSGLLGSFSAGVATTARALAFVGADLYVGGNFTIAGGVDAKGCARWNGTDWFNIGDADATVRALAYDGSMLFVGGAFTNIGGINSPGLALHLPGGGWLSLGTLAGGNRAVNAIARDGTDIYIGGNFTSIDAIGLTNIARWNGSSWFPLGNGVNNTVTALIASNGVVYAGGTFTFASGVSVSRIARWNGSSWSALGGGVSGSTASTTISSFLLSGSDLYVTGTFTNASGIYALGLAKWDGATWSAPFGSGLIASPGTANATTLALIGHDLYVGGQFAFAGDKPSMLFGRWNDQKNFYPPPQPRLINPRLTDGQFGFRLAGTSGERYVIESTTDFATWVPRLTNSTPLFDFTDTSTSNAPASAYRALLR